MLQSSERETEILLGNKQLLAIFFVGVALLGIAFTGGYMMGRGSSGKKAALPSPPAAESTANVQSPVGETHSVVADEGAASAGDRKQTAEGQTVTGRSKETDGLLGARKNKTGKAAGSKADSFTPQSGQEFLQVTAVPHDHAMAIAAVLRNKGFHAHAVPKPGNGDLYRVIVGPIRDPGELSSTRDSLRKTGFGQVIVQRYQ